MQVTSDTTAFLLSGQDQLVTRVAQFGRQPDGLNRSADPARQVVEHPSVGGRELLAAAAWGQDQASDLLAALGE